MRAQLDAQQAKVNQLIASIDADEAAIQSASNATGVDFGFMLGTARRESGYNPNAKAPTSSAATV